MIDMPKRDLFIIPVLRAMQDGKPRLLSEIYLLVADIMNLSSEQRNLKTTKGAIAFETHIAFMLSFLQNVGALSRLSPGEYEFTDAGREVLNRFPEQTTEKELRAWTEEDGSPIRPYVPRGSRNKQGKESGNEDPTTQDSSKGHLYTFQNIGADNKESISTVTALAGVSRYVLERAPVYEIAALFKSQVIDQHRSLLWPDQTLWTDELIKQFLADFGNNEGGQHWLDAFSSQLDNSDPDAAKLVADSHAFLMQFPSVRKLKGSTKAAQLHTILNWIPDSPESNILGKVLSAYEIGIGSPGPAFTNATPHQIAFVPLLVLNMTSSEKVDLLDVVEKCAAEAGPVWGFRKSVRPAMNVCLHLLEPLKYERIASDSQKNAIVEGFIPQLDEQSFEGVVGIDEQIRQIRHLLEDQHFPAGFDFYDAEIVPYWQGDKLLNEPSSVVGGELDDHPTIHELAAATHLTESFLREIEALLTDKKQLIFEGPPGSGKTFVADKFARFFAGQPLADNAPNDNVELIQFHQSYGYEDFVEGIRPRMDNGQLVYQVEAGVFLKMVKKAAEAPSEKFVLIIDEINRGNVSRILGELMLLMEYRDKSARLPYSKDLLQIPPNLYIIGTMNSADRSLSQIDYALRRRFYFVRFMSVENGTADVLHRWLQVGENSAADAAQRQLVVNLFVELNSRLSTQLNTNDLQVGHSYFMHGQMHEKARQEQVWKYAVEPLLREYLYHDRERDKHMELFGLETILAAITKTAEIPASLPAIPADNVGSQDEGEG